MCHLPSPIQEERLLHMILSEDNPTCSPVNASPIADDSAFERKAKPEEISPFEHGFRVGRAEGMIALIDAMADALDPAAAVEPAYEEAVPEPSRVGPDFVNLCLAKMRPAILIVDDEPINIDLLADTLEVDYEVFAAEDGKNAVDTAVREMPDLILLDVIMPGIDGYEVCRRLKENRRTQDIPVIFVTALGGGEAEMTGLEMGARDYLTKPIDPISVRARVNNQVKLKYAQDKLSRLATLEQTLRENLLEALEAKARSN
jgi:PleD family two-component response regulator